MLYFSELYKKGVFTENGKWVGVLDDLIFSITKVPFIKKIVIAEGNLQSPLKTLFAQKNQILIDVSYLIKFSPTKIIIKNNYESTTISENELYIRKNVLDTQVIDIEENNIVRVNDVLIQKIEGRGFEVYGVDIGLAGALRWFHLEEVSDHLMRYIGKPIPQNTLAWTDIQPLELTRGRVKLNHSFNRLKNLHPSDLADYLESQNLRNSLTLLQSVDKEYLAQVISELNPSFQIDILKRMSIDKVALLLSSMDPDDAVDVLNNFSATKRSEILKKMPEDDANNLKKLLLLGSTSLGQFLNSDFLTVYSDDLTSEVLKKIKEQTLDYSMFEYVYVVNRDKQLIGVFSLHEFLLQNMYTPVYRFMVQHVIAANLTTPIEVAFRRMIRYKIASLPVIDRKRRIIGVVSIDDVGEQLLGRSQ